MRQLLQVEQSLVFIGVLLCALFAVVKPGAPLLFIAVIILTIGNPMYLLQTSAAPLHVNRSFPLNWVIFLPILAAGSLLCALGSIALVRLMQPSAGPYWGLFRETWKIVFVVATGVGIAGYAVQEVQRKLQEKNKAREQVVERGSAALNSKNRNSIARERSKPICCQKCPRNCQVSSLLGPGNPRAVGGDYFDVICLDDSRLGICIGDVCGKGITAPLLMANLQAAFRAYATADAKPSEVCCKLNEFVCGNVAPGKFITFFYAILDARTRTLTYENAGYCAGLLMKNNGETEQLRGQGGVLGVRPEWTYADSTLALAQGDRLLFFTDSVTEAENTKEEEFGYQGIANAAGTGPSSSAELKSKIMKAVEEFCHGEFRDDVALVVACIR